MSNGERGFHMWLRVFLISFGFTLGFIAGAFVALAWRLLLGG